MYVSDTHKPQPRLPPSPAIDFYKNHQHHRHNPDHDHPHHHPRPIDDDDDADHDMMIEIVTTTENPQMVIAACGDAGSGGDDLHAFAGGRSSSVAPKKRAETWVHDETRCLIGLRREMDSLFNTSKSNKHLWEQISAKMREKGFDRSPTMCTDKWRNLLKEFKKVKQQSSGGGSAATAKMSYYKEIDEILRERSRNASAYKASAGTTTTTASPEKVDSFIQFSDKGIEEASMPYGPIEANDRHTLNLERRLDHNGHPLAITGIDTVETSEVPPSFWRETSGNRDKPHPYGRVISIKWGDYTRRVGIDGTTDAISHAIKSAFGIRTKRAFWLEDEDQVVRSLDREMPLGSYALHLDEGVTIKVCYDEPDQIQVHTEERTFYAEEDLREFLNRRGWSALRELHGYGSIDNLDDLRSDALYRGVN